MIRKELVSQRNLKDQSGGSFRVDYFITVEPERIGEPEPAYGLCIEKTEGGLLESYEAARCFHEYAPAYAMAEKLSRFSVTPAGAEETIESILEYISR